MSVQSVRHLHCLSRTEVVLCPQEETPRQLVQRARSEFPLMVYVGYHHHVVQVDQGVMPLHVWQHGLEKNCHHFQAVDLPALLLAQPGIECQPAVAQGALT